VGIRDSKDREGPVLVFRPHEWEAFLAGVRDGEFDLPKAAAGSKSNDEIHETTPALSSEPSWFRG
jgi:hypothetical protein